MPWVAPAVAAAHFKIAERTLRERSQRDPDRWRRNGAGRYWLPDPPMAVPAPVAIDALPPAQPKRDRPVTTIEAPRPQPVSSAGLSKWILVPDCHVPYHDRAAVALMLRAAQAIGAVNAVILGDFADFFAVSSHPKSPERKADLDWEVTEVNAALDLFDRTFTGEKKFIAGNHENRLERYLTSQAPALFNTMKVEALFRLQERGWLYTPYRSHTSIGKLFLTHDAGKAGRNAHVDAMNAFQSNVAIGHTHRLQYAVEGNVQGKPHVGVSLGWLGSVEHCEYMYRVRAARDWAHAFGVAYVEPDGCVHVVPVPIVNGRVVVEGKLIR